MSVVVVLEPFARKSSMLKLASFLDFLNFCSNEDMGGKLWLLLWTKFGFKGVASSNQSLTGWCKLNDTRTLIMLVYGNAIN